MLKNEYRRAMIMLRGLMRGCGGFVRLERRTLIASMQFNIHGAPQGGLLHAALLGRRGGVWRAYALGDCARDGRGQAGLQVRFDPRDIGGMTLEEAELVCVVHERDGACELALSGFPNGSFDVNWAQAREAARSLYDRDEPITDLPEPLETDEEAEEATERAAEEAAPADEIAEGEVVEQPEQTAVETTEETAEAVAEPAPETPVREASDEPCDDAAADAPRAEYEETVEDGTREAVAETIECPVIGADDPVPVPPEACVIVEEEEAAEELETAEAAEAPEEGSEAAESADDAEERAQASPACTLLELDIAQPWPEMIEPLRALFQRETAFLPFAADGYVFIRAPMPTESGISFCAVGIRCEDGKPSSVCYAIPARFDVEPPPGLRDCVWRGGAQSGYWTVWQRADTGESVEPAEEA